LLCALSRSASAKRRKKPSAFSKADGKTLAFVEVRTRTVRDEMSALPELSVTPGKQRLLARTAQHFLAERRVPECPCRFDVVAIDNSLGKPPVVRLHKDAFSPQM
jgi:putative endonuclease